MYPNLIKVKAGVFSSLEILKGVNLNYLVRLYGNGGNYGHGLYQLNRTV